MTGGPIIVGIDSAPGLTGLAILDGNRLVNTSAVTIAGWADVARSVQEILAFNPVLVVVEDCFVGPNPDTGIALAKLVGRWEQSFQSRGVQTAAVLASTWQVDILGVSHRARRAERKTASIAWAKATFGVVLSEDCADAAAIATWGALHLSRCQGASRPENVAPGASGEVGPTPAVSGLAASAQIVGGGR